MVTFRKTRILVVSIVLLFVLEPASTQGTAASSRKNHIPRSRSATVASTNSATAPSDMLISRSVTN